MEAQAEVRMAAFHPSLAVLGCAASGVTMCRRAGVPTVPLRSRGGWGDTRNAGTYWLAGGAGTKPAARGREPGRAEGPSSAMLRLLAPGGSSPLALSAAGLLSKRSLILGSCRLIPSKGLRRPHLQTQGDFATSQVSLGKKGNLLQWIELCSLVP